MIESSRFVNGCSASSIPCVTEGDIEVAECILGLRFDEPRRSILRSNESFDVQACPGSGKTTLLVAKLAILARKWPHVRRGMCVISHTNVARREIESKLAGTGVDQRLLNYPHFVGTIHGFVNQFLALPFLRSEGYLVEMIDDDAHGDFCTRLLHTHNAYAIARNFLSRKEANTPDRTIRGLRYEGPSLTLGSAAGALPCGPDSASYRSLAEIKRAVVAKGIWRFDDMFAWAEKLLAEFPHVCELVRWRFPAVFLDESQDTSELQAALLEKVFPASACELRQRFGDSNQAIYDTGQAEASTDRFPAEGFRSVTDSQRFGSSIACLAHPMAPKPPKPELFGNGPRTIAGAPEPASIRHTILLFSQSSANQVLPAFGRLILETFADGVLRSDQFLARAIGRVGVSQKEVDKIPRNLSDYWNGYEALAAKLEPRPSELLGYIRLARHRRVSTGECSESVKLATRGVTELIRLVKPDAIPWGLPASRWLLEALKSNPESIQSIRRSLWEWCVEARPVVEESWREEIEGLKVALSPVLDGEWSREAEDFCQCSAKQDGPLPQMGTGRSPAQNVVRFEADGRQTDIDIGTIHSAKGQTHAATLVLETFAWEHDLGDLLPWLSGQKSGAPPSESTRRLERMRLVYTAMTRPSHLLCLALRSDAVRQTSGDSDLRHKLVTRGWRLIDLDSAQAAADVQVACSCAT